MYFLIYHSRWGNLTNLMRKKKTLKSRFFFFFFFISYSRIELVPQLKKDGTPQIRTPSRFALFVKENFARIKNGNEHVSHQEIMKALSSEFAKLNT